MKVQIRKAGEYPVHSGPVYMISRGPDGTFMTGGADRRLICWKSESPEDAFVLAQTPGAILSALPLTALNQLLIGTTEGKIHVIDLNRNQEVRIVSTHPGGIFSIIDTGDYILTSGADGSVSVWDPTLRFIKTRNYCEGKIRALVPFGENRVLAACGDGFIRLLELPTLELIRSFEAHQSSVNCICISPDGSLIISGGRDAHLNIWSAEDFSLQKSIPAHNYAIYSVVYSPEGKFLTSCSRDKTIKLWDPTRFEVLFRIEKELSGSHAYSVNQIYWNKLSGNLISTGDDRQVMVWELA